MKKTEVIIFVILIVFALSWRVSAIVGVSPGGYEVDFQPGLKESYIFRYSFDAGVHARVYAKGDLAEYVTLSTDSLVGGGTVIATLDLPGEVEVPGDHKLYIGAEQQADEQGGGVGIIGNVRGVILVKVPYPGKYASIADFHVTNANQGEPVNFTLYVNNLGKEAISVDAFVEIFDKSDSSVEIIYLGGEQIPTTGSRKFHRQFPTTNYKPGDYKARAIVKYEGGELNMERIFRLGSLYVEIQNYTNEFTRDKLNSFDIDIESFWNDPIKNVYADVKIVNHDIKFSTPSLDLKPWQKAKLTGFFDTSGIEEDKFQANITLHYSGRETSKIVDLRFKKETNYVLYALVGGGIFVGIMIISLIISVIILLTRNKNGKHKK